MTSRKTVEEHGVTRHYLDDELHCDSGPAVIHTRGGYKEWWVNGKPHRLDGPAVCWDDPANQQHNEYWINGHEYPKETFEFLTSMKEDYENTNKPNVHLNDAQLRIIIKALETEKRLLATALQFQESIGRECDDVDSLKLEINELVSIRNFLRGVNLK